ncbi:Na/Pi cotransporter family protein [Anaerofustis stercorihominis]|uniref:Na/Pi cotransporter family protein n=1 Tax=Anaerofustis stercorihominis TaxID=214853 RepID=UPI00210C5637|nr:Na/Pi cotransporter family protein [Anaerofustis stercorihominis]MCQ4794402.1 Na/Pi cotransporter family protein [Anaerofustis stercorihominis]
MTFTNILTLCGGLGFFLFGMKYMGDGLELAAGARMKKLLEALTRNPVMGFLVGLVVTAVIQSSSATTVMVMGFINAGMMTLNQAVGIIIGANVGTTVTSIIIALDISAIAPICIFIGAMLLLFAKKQNKKHIGQIILGFGILFQGLSTMSGAMVSLRTYQPFIDFISSANSPIIGVLVGTILCAILQSSSAAVGVLQALALQGLMPANFAIYLVCGVNIGSAAPPLLSAINAKTNAKRASFIYLIYNLFGAILFVPIGMFTPFADFVVGTFAAPVAQVAMIHIIFKLVTAVVLLPFTNTIVNLSYKIIPDREHSSNLRFYYLDPQIVTNSASLLVQIISEIKRMADISKDSLFIAGNDFIYSKSTDREHIKENEELVNWLSEHLTEFFIKINSMELQGKDSEHLSRIFYVINDIKRINDHAVNLMEKSEEAVKKEVRFSDNARKELKALLDNDLELLDKAVESFTNQEISEDEQVELYSIEEEIDKLTLKAQENHVLRLREGRCGVSTGMLYIQSLTDFERVGDHAYNIACAARQDSEVLRTI